MPLCKQWWALEKVFPEEVYYPINTGQIEVRKNGYLSESSIIRLEEMESVVKTLSGKNEDGQYDISTVFVYCKAVLTKEINKADEIYSKLDERDQAAIDSWPIKTLHEKLKEKLK